ncbi:MAG: outer membrane lipid asymmetry maintenance protein MlaD [Desulfobacterales bacterium]|jgi:phospholipid/cholesterol/gamma-HCH transport system substrate-binding protein|nr:outer membrane lipid asymmetry maintenance protein MlaD [Desulfobacterales bacterium]
MQKYSKESVVGIFVLVGLACIGYMTIQLGDLGLFDDDTYPLTARFTQVTGLRSGSVVNMFGLEVGRVEKMTMDQDKQMAVVELRIRKGIKVYDDAIASIKTEGLIGDRYISIDAGGSGAELKPGDTITETEAPADIMDLVSKYAFGDVKK